jgi:hypothetical protein
MTICKLGLTSSSIAQHLSIIVHLDATSVMSSMRLSSSCFWDFAFSASIFFLVGGSVHQEVDEERARVRMS